jgi:glucose/arabinose dehydrogenase
MLFVVVIMIMNAAGPGGGPAAAAQELPPLFVVNAFPNHTFVLPVDIAHAGDSRLFVVEKPGVIRVLNGRGPSATDKVFLDIKDRVIYSGELGLLGLAFHPDFKQNGYFFVNYTRPEGERWQTIVARYQVTADPDKADPTSELILLTIPQPYTNHNGGGLKFAPDGTLYIGLGDGGGSGDPDNRAQDGADLLGKMLRIDVDNPAPGKNYGIPDDNPFVGQPALDEIWATGLRNPWRFSFDRLTGDLYIGDVGQNLWEEIDFQPAARAGGQNYGWRLKEGNHCFNPEQNCDTGGLTDPVYEYGHDEGCSVTGGFVYRGPSMPALQGYYLYADYCKGIISALYRDGQDEWQNEALTNSERFVSTFGEDSSGEIYLTQLREGKIYKLAEKRGMILLPLIRE